MSRSLGSERAHFGGEGGLVTETSLGRTRYFWWCAYRYCDWEMGGKNFQNNKTRIHLSGDPKLRNGLVSRVCLAAPSTAKNQGNLMYHWQVYEKTTRRSRGFLNLHSHAFCRQKSVRGCRCRTFGRRKWMGASSHHQRSVVAIEWLCSHDKAP